MDTSSPANLTRLQNGIEVNSSADVDPLLAKLLVRSFDRTSAVEEMVRALHDVSIDGVTANLSLLQGVARIRDFRNCQSDTKHLEGHVETIMHDIQIHSPHRIGGPGERGICDILQVIQPYHKERN